MRAPEDKRIVIIADIHGNCRTLWDLLRETGSVDVEGNKTSDTWVCQLGDLLHCGHEVLEEDAETLRMGLDYCDCLLVGNHELPFVTSIQVGFAGQHEELHPDTRRLLHKATFEGRLEAAASAGDWLITHAGLNLSFLFADLVPMDVRKELLANSQSAELMADHLNERFERRACGGPPDPVIEEVGESRGGKGKYGGIFWCEWLDLRGSLRRYESPFRQIVGHTPREDAAPIMDESKSAWNIDLAGIDTGYCAALIKERGSESWRCVTVRRQRRAPLSHEWARASESQPASRGVLR